MLGQKEILCSLVCEAQQAVGSVIFREDAIAEHMINNNVVVLPCFCKDCIHRHWMQEPEHGKTVHYCELTDCEVADNFFCGEAKSKNRKE